LENDGSEIATEADVLSSSVVVGEDGAGLSSVVGVSVDGARRAGADLDVELCPAKELEYCFERRSCTSHSVLRA
jgi:hypothetical protein